MIATGRTSDRDQARRLAELMAHVQSDLSESATVENIVAHALEALDDTDHVSLTMRQRRGWVTLASTSPTALDLDALQYSLAEGPCVEALAEAEWFRSGNVAVDSRWPSWGPAAARRGCGSLMSVGLVARGERVGALNMYADELDRFRDAEVVDVALGYATDAAYALSSARLVTGLETAMACRHTIGLAQGRLMERYALDRTQAFALLKRVSSAANIKLRDVAEHFVESGHLPELGERRPGEDRGSGTAAPHMVES